MRAPLQRYLKILLLTLFPASPAWSQIPGAIPNFDPHFEKFILPGGEVANMVQCIIQDKTGFLWFGSRSGLIRYDGRQMITYRHNPLDTGSIAADYINWIFEDSKGILWLGHCCDGLTAFDPATEKCVRYRHEENDLSSLADNYVSMITEDRSGKIWIATGAGLDCFSPAPARGQRGKIKHYRHDPRDPRSLSAPFIRTLYVDKKGALWVGCGWPYDVNNIGGLNRYHPDSDNFTRYEYDPQNPNSLADNRIQTMFEDKRGNFWVGTSGKTGLHRMETAGQTVRFTRLPFDPRHPARLSSPALQRNDHLFPEFERITFMLEDQQNRLWIGAVEGGLNVYDPATEAVRHFERATGMPDSLQSISLWHACQTRDGAVWICCGDNGPVYRVQNTNDLFPFYHTGSLSGLGNSSVTGILKEPSRTVWLQTVGDFNGVVRIDPGKPGRCKRFPYQPAASWHIFPDLFNLGADRQGNIWASTEQGLYRMNTAAPGDGCFHPDPALALEKEAQAAWPPFHDRQGNRWVATFGDGLYRFNADKGTTDHFLHNPNDTGSIGGNLVQQVFEDRQGHLWVLGASDKYDSHIPMFFDRFDPQRQIFTHFLPPGEIGNPSSVVEDQNGHFWFTAFPLGIRKLDPQTREYKSFTVGNSPLSTNEIMEMQLGDDGNIWMFAKDAILKLNPETESCFAYFIPHRIQPNSNSHFWITGSCTGADGAIFFGGNGGFHAFYPKEIQRITVQYPAKACITDLNVMGKRVAPGRGAILSRPVWESAGIRLAHDNNVFSFNIATFEYGSPEMSRLEYRLENYDRDWRNDLREGQATYINVPPGNYVFRVRGANSMGIQVPETSLRVVILPPWWRSWWAYSLYVVLIAGSLYAFYRFQLNRKMEQAEALRLRELDAVKTRLYANITHEFRTPLTLLIGPTERMLREKPVDDDVRGVLQLVRRNAHRLLMLVNQMLDLSKLESGKMALHLIQGDILSYFRYVVESFHSMAENKNIRIHLLTGLESLTMDFDEEKMQQIVSNLLSNALKFTPEGGNVYVTLEKTAAGESGAGNKPGFPPQPLGYLTIAVRDTGVGIPEDKIDRIFDRFYQADDSPTRAAEGTGIGLALAKELVKLMGGNIRVISRPDWGTEFRIVLPLHRSETTADAPVWTSREKSAPAANASLPTGVLPAAGNGHTDSDPLVLLVEDNADVIAYLASCLPDYRLAAARDGQEGLEIAADIVPDIIISDVMMPRMDGFDLCRALKNDLRTSHIPIILLTAKADFSSKLEGLEQGADAFLAKPFRQEELALRIRKLLENRQKLQQHYLAAAGLAEEAVLLKDVPQVSNLDHAFVKKVRAAVEAHLDDAGFDVEKLCRAIAMSHSQAHRKLSALTGFSATRFMRYIRLTKAKELLQNTNCSIIAIAFDTGFSDPAYFSRVFKQEFGVPPQKWREGV